MAEMTRAFVCGHPIAHSRSPRIHGYWLEKYGIAGSYEAVDVAPADVAGFFATLAEKGFAGGNVTIPHKEAAFEAVARRDAAATRIGAVNTLWFEDGAGELPADPKMLPRHAIVTDIVYVPLETPLLCAARKRGLKTVDGLGMLLHQAVPGFERWFGRRPKVTKELRAMIVADMETAAAENP